MGTGSDADPSHFPHQTSPFYVQHTYIQHGFALPKIWFLFSYHNYVLNSQFVLLQICSRFKSPGRAGRADVVLEAGVETNNSIVLAYSNNPAAFFPAKRCRVAKVQFRVIGLLIGIIRLEKRFVCLLQQCVYT